MPPVSQQEWSEFFQACPEAHILQSPAWGILKGDFDWQPCPVIRDGLGAQVLFQELPGGFQVAYIPRGPLSLAGEAVDHPAWPGFLEDLNRLCRSRRAVFLKLEPDSWQDEREKPPAGFRPSSHSIQPPRTLVVDLQDDEDKLLGRMKSKTRYNIRLSARKGVEVSTLDQVKPFYELLAGTSGRAAFGIHTLEYYQRAFSLFAPTGQCQIFYADYQGKGLASIMVFLHGKRSWYFYGGSSSEHRELMATYLVQWEAMRWARDRGCLTYDLWGVPDQEQDQLEKQFTSRSDGLWGVYRFKRGFGGQLLRTSGPWDRTYRPILYGLYRLRNQLAGEGE